MILSITLAIFIHTMASATPATSASLTAQAIEWLQKNEKQKALKILEKAFELAHEPEEIRQVGRLILEAAPANYPKRESYLRYLIKFSPENAELGKWLKELGDISFDEGKFDHAEDYYLRALAHYENPQIVRYKLAWVYWNQKVRARAFDTFLALYTDADSKLREQIRKDTAKLWWELVRLPQTQMQAFGQLSDSDTKLFMDEYFALTPNKKESAEKIENSFLQIKDEEKTSPHLLAFLKGGFLIKDMNCLMFRKVLEPFFEYPREHLLLCAKLLDEVTPARLLPFFDALPEDDRNEKIDWANAELLFMDQKNHLGIQMLIESQPLQSRSKEFVEYTEAQLVKLTDSEFQTMATTISPENLKFLVSQNNSSPILNRLQKYNPNEWIPYQQKALAGQDEPKEFLIKKASWLSQKNPIDLNELDLVLRKIFSKKLNPSEEGIKAQFEKMDEDRSKQLPNEFDGDFQAAYKLWLENLDRSIIILSGASPEWKAITWPLLRQRITQNIFAIRNQIREVDLPPDSKEFREEFEYRKVKLEKELTDKYREYIADDSQRQIH